MHRLSEKKSLKVVSIVLMGCVVLGLVLFRVTGRQNLRPGEVYIQSDKSAAIPLLSLPFSIADIENVNGMINPIGVVRSGMDQPDIGHPGLDVPLRQGADILAVADGQIVGLRSASDPWGGMNVILLLHGAKSGEGWAYLYEHVTPRDGLAVGDTLRRGEVVAHKVAPRDFTVHLQLSYVFDNYQYTSNNQCWVDFLEESARQDFLGWWQSYRESEYLQNAWNDVVTDGKYPFRRLPELSTSEDGLQLCYPLGTDVR